MNPAFVPLIKQLAPLLEPQVPKISEFLKRLVLDKKICEYQPKNTSAGIWVSLDSNGNLVFVPAYLDSKANLNPQSYKDANGNFKPIIKGQKEIEKLLIDALLNLDKS